MTLSNFPSPSAAAFAVSPPLAKPKVAGDSGRRKSVGREVGAAAGLQGRW